VALLDGCQVAAVADQHREQNSLAAERSMDARTSIVMTAKESRRLHALCVRNDARRAVSFNIPPKPFLIRSMEDSLRRVVPVWKEPRRAIGVWNETEQWM
jgi:hypothetical protein